MLSEGEIVGLRGLSNGRTCPIHESGCGNSLLVGDTVRFVRRTVLDGGVEEVSIGVVKVVGEVDTCLVGFVPKYLVTSGADLVGRMAVVTRKYENSGRASEREVDYRNLGVARYTMLDM